MSAEVWIANEATGPQYGTKDNPFAVQTAWEFDKLLDSLLHTSDLAVHLSGAFKTKGAYRWGQYATRNLGAGWTVDGVAEVALDPVAIADIDSQPLYCLAGPAARVTGIRTRGNHSKLASGWKGTLRTGGVLLEGDGAIDSVRFSDFGSKGAETFVGIVSNGAGDARITGCAFDEFDPTSSDDQVTVFAIMCELAADAYRSDALMENNSVVASGKNQVQAHTIYQTLKGRVQKNRSASALVGYYGDYYRTKHVDISLNEFLGCEHGVQLKLSPTPEDIARNFAHEDYTIGPNRIESSGANVSIDTVGPPTDSRFIRVSVDRSLTLENFGGVVTRTGADLSTRRGCNPFKRS
jgi:hypothetical protein